MRQRVHGLTPWPGCAVTVDDKPLKLTRVGIAEESAAHPSPGVIDADGTIACGTGSVRLLAVQPPGGKQMSFHAYTRGHRVTPGSRIGPQ